VSKSAFHPRHLRHPRAKKSLRSRPKKQRPPHAMVNVKLAIRENPLHPLNPCSPSLRSRPKNKNSGPSHDGQRQIGNP
jgi:hypothetical protein